MNRVRVVCAVLFVALFPAAVYAQDVVGGTLIPRISYSTNPGSTNILLDSPFNADGQVNTLTVDVTAYTGFTTCAAGDTFNVRVFRPGSPGYAQVADIGPISERVGRSTLTLTTPIAVQRGDVIGFIVHGNTQCSIIGGYGSQYRLFYVPSDYHGGSVSSWVDGKGNGYSIRLSSAASTLVGTLPAVGVTAGAAGSAFNSLISMTNSESTPVTLQFVLHPVGAGGASPFATASQTLAGYASKTVKFQELFPTGSIGSVDVYSSGGTPVLNARVYNDTGSGTNGFTEPMVLPAGAQVAKEYDAVWLTMPADFSAFRMNIGLRTFNNGAQLDCLAVNASGTAVAEITKNYPANWTSLEPLQQFFGGNAAALTPGGSVQCFVPFAPPAKSDIILYGTITDNHTNDSALFFADKH